MRFKGLDLNLLVVLDRLLHEKNVSRAAEKLHLSQSATSGALARLRDYFGDELLTQVGRNMVLTPRALELSEMVRQSLLQIEGTILHRPVFDPTTAQRRINIIASDYLTIAGLADALKSVTQQAPGLTFKLISPSIEPARLLERGEVDLVAMPEIYLSPDHPFAALFSETYVVVVWKDNSIFGDTISEDEFLNAQHVTVAFPTSRPSYESWFLERFGTRRMVDIEVGSFAAVPFLLTGTNRVALMHAQLARVFEKILPVRLLPSPIDIPPMRVGLQWNRLNDNDECLRFVSDIVVRQLNGH